MAPALRAPPTPYGAGPFRFQRAFERNTEMDLIIRDVANTAYRGKELLHPLMRGPIERMEAVLQGLYSQKLTKDNFQVFETWRHPQRQASLSKDVTGAGAWRSAHQYGLAVDFAVFTEKGGWSWGQEHDWGLLKRVAREVGLTIPVAGDLGHVEHPRWATIRQYMK